MRSLPQRKRRALCEMTTAVLFMFILDKGVRPTKIKVET